MAIPLLQYPPTSQNHRVEGFEIPTPEKPRLYTTELLTSSTDMDELIWAAYRQVFNEQQLLSVTYQKSLESQLRSGQITVRDFMRSLLVSETFRIHNYEPNNNYRFVELCIQRVLGREVYGEREKLAWSVVLATEGLHGFIDQLLNSEEYLTHFGDRTVPYQRRRILPQRSQGNLPIARMPRYGEDYRQKLEELGYFQPPKTDYRWSWQQPPYPAWIRLTGKLIAFSGAGLLALGVGAVALAAWGIIPL
ncbi:phycobilisome rod-core linker polypeptide [Roseofilum capinflatum]|uniref:Phycobilisome rod-core linker polypeptide n=1 Tax=Roseofilum capinflatum BLCC-M114 TaxID=3022440 RepID=A0ABT7B4E7_9CYAN|nr:phycobilisome rod-core linker polypeptide [Roseofilum capinflatum]MDJ1174024.1 phycobilisome rod-core linker polypeptide [Roseofilum capinflatum BLCC-M114]